MPLTLTEVDSGTITPADCASRMSLGTTIELSTAGRNTGIQPGDVGVFWFLAIDTQHPGFGASPEFVLMKNGVEANPFGPDGCAYLYTTRGMADFNPITTIAFAYMFGVIQNTTDDTWTLEWNVGNSDVEGGFYTLYRPSSPLTVEFSQGAGNLSADAQLTLTGTSDPVPIGSYEWFAGDESKEWLVLAANMHALGRPYNDPEITPSGIGGMESSWNTVSGGNIYDSCTEPLFTASFGGWYQAIEVTSPTQVDTFDDANISFASDGGGDVHYGYANYTAALAFATPPNAAASVKIQETKLRLKQLPHKVHASSLDGWS